MLVIPAIDLKGGQCVRLQQGDPAKSTVYSSDPVEMAKWWSSLGARRLHVVDLDGALGGGTNLDQVFSIIEKVGMVVQFGGGLRDLESVWKIIKRGVDRAIIGTAILKDPTWVKEAVEEYPGRLMASLDARNGEVKIEGWQAGSGKSVAEVIKLIEGLGFQELIYTDISRDGMLQGPNIESIRTVLKSTKMAVYASGGISKMEDIKALKKLEGEGLRGCILGKALYDGHVDLAEAISVAK